MQHVTLTNVNVLKISLLYLAALILIANQSHWRNWHMHREGGRRATVSICGTAVTSFEMEWWYQTALIVDGNDWLNCARSCSSSTGHVKIKDYLLDQFKKQHSFYYFLHFTLTRHNKSASWPMYGIAGF